MSKLVKSIEEVAYHRNGVGGEGFYAIRFTADAGEVSEKEAARLNLPAAVAKKDLKWLAILFDGPGQCAVICLDLIESCGVKFAGGNSWRGDHYEPELREAIKARNNDLSGGVRVGPFCVPK